MMLSENRDSFAFSFPIFTTLLPTVLARISRTISNRSGELKNPSLIFDFRAKVLSQSFTIKYNDSCRAFSRCPLSD